MSKLCYFLVFFTLFADVFAQNLPSFIKPCRRSDAEFTTCLTNAVQAALPFMADGLPEAGIPSVDPLKVENIKVNQPALKIQFDDGYILGLKSCKVNEFRIDPANKKMYLNYTKNGSFNGKYKVNGRILIIPIEGEGNCKIKFKNLNYFFTIDYDMVKGADGKDHWKILKHQTAYNADKVVYKFENVLGNKQLDETVHRIVNENWQSIFNDMSPPIMKKVTRSIMNVLSKFFDFFAIDDITLP